MRLRSGSAAVGVVAMLSWPTLGCQRPDPGSLVAPTIKDLENVYATRDPRMAGHQHASAVIVDAEGILVVANADTHGDGDHTWLLRLSDSGEVRWERHYPDSLGAGRAIATLPNGDVVIAGSVKVGSMAYRGNLLRVARDGQVVANRGYGPGGVTGFDAVAVLDDGSIVAGGMKDFKGWLVRTDQELRPISERSIDDEDQVKAIATLGQGRFVTAALKEHSLTGFGLTRMTAFTTDWGEQWRLDLPAVGRGEPTALAVLTDGNLLLAGHIDACKGCPSEWWAAGLSRSGSAKWERRFGWKGESRRARAVAPLPDGGAIIAGFAVHGLFVRDVRVARMTKDGEAIWHQAYDKPDSDQDTAEGIATFADGGSVFVGSTQAGPGKTNVWVVRLDPNGRQLWDRVFAMPEVKSKAQPQ